MVGAQAYGSQLLMPGNKYHWSFLTHIGIFKVRSLYLEKISHLDIRMQMKLIRGVRIGIFPINKIGIWCYYLRFTKKSDFILYSKLLNGNTYKLLNYIR